MNLSSLLSPAPDEGTHSGSLTFRPAAKSDGQHSGGGKIKKSKGATGSHAIAPAPQRSSRRVKEHQASKQRVQDLTSAVASASRTGVTSALGSSSGVSKGSASRKRKYAGRVKRACENCKKGKRCCDEGRPCARCLRLGLEKSCRDAKRKHAERVKDPSSSSTSHSQNSSSPSVSPVSSPVSHYSPIQSASSSPPHHTQAPSHTESDFAKLLLASAKEIEAKQSPPLNGVSYWTPNPSYKLYYPTTDTLRHLPPTSSSSSSNPNLHWDTSATEPGGGAIHVLLRTIMAENSTH